MKIRLIDVDSKIPNLALMKLSAWHKAQGNNVEWFNPLFDDGIDIIYASKVFDFTPDYQYLLRGNSVHIGGSGYDLKTKLSDEVEHCYPDYSLYPSCDYAMGFTSRGCSRKCEFCIVPQKEGGIKAVADIYEFWRGQEHIKLLDNNLTAIPDHFELILGQLIKERIRADFNQGLDIQLITPQMSQLLAKVRIWKQIHFAFDDIRYEKAVRAGIATLVENGIRARKLMFYVLIGFNSTPDEDLYRVEVLRGLGVDPFVMPFDKHDKYQKRFARWVNHKAIFKTVKWAEYL